jgi:hypothetical protein
VIRDAIIELLETCGPVTGLLHESELLIARQIHHCMPNVEMFRMLGSGTESVMAALRISRIATGAKRVIKIGVTHKNRDPLPLRCATLLHVSERRSIQSRRRKSITVYLYATSDRQERKGRKRLFAKNKDILGKLAIRIHRAATIRIVISRRNHNGTFKRSQRIKNSLGDSRTNTLPIEQISCDTEKSDLLLLGNFDHPKKRSKLRLSRTLALRKRKIRKATVKMQICRM